MYIHPYSIIQNSFTTLKIPCAPPIILSFPPLKPLAVTDLFTPSIVPPFPECHIVGITQYTAFSRLASFTQHYALKVSPCLLMA